MKKLLQLIVVCFLMQAILTGCASVNYNRCLAHMKEMGISDDHAKVAYMNQCEVTNKMHFTTQHSDSVVCNPNGAGGYRCSR